MSCQCLSCACPGESRMKAMLTVEIIYAFVIKCAPAGEARGTPNPWLWLWSGVEWSVVRPLVGFLAGSKKTNAIKAKELELNGVKRKRERERGRG